MKDAPRTHSMHSTVCYGDCAIAVYMCINLEITKAIESNRKNTALFSMAERQVNSVSINSMNIARFKTSARRNLFTRINYLF